MILFGLGYVGQLAATALARACGGDPEIQSECRKLAATLTILVDPIGTGLGMAQELGTLWCESENDAAKSRAEDDRRPGQT
jgi:hypothetical protein